MIQINVPRLRAYYLSGRTGRDVLNRFAERQKGKTITVDTLADDLWGDCSRVQIIEALKNLEELGLGNFVTGRRGKPSRFEANIPLREIGTLASGDTHRITPDVGEIESGDDGESGLTQTPASDVKPPYNDLTSHSYSLRPNLIVTVSLPPDLTPREAERFAEFLKTLPY